MPDPLFLCSIRTVGFELNRGMACRVRPVPQCLRDSGSGELRSPIRGNFARTIGTYRPFQVQRLPAFGASLLQSSPAVGAKQKVFLNPSLALWTSALLLDLLQQALFFEGA